MSVTGLSPAAMRMMIGSARRSRDTYGIEQNLRPSRTGRRLPRKVSPLSRPAAAHRLAADELNRLILSIAASSDRAAFERLFHHFAPRVKAYLLKGGADSGLSEEIAQETMLTVWRKAAYFDPRRAGASTWIFTIARNLRIDEARRDGRGVAMPFDPSQEPEGPFTAETLMTVAQRDDRVRDVLKLLPPEQAEIVKLSFFNNEPHSEIARTLKIPLGTVKSRLRLAMSRLRAALEGVEP